MNSLYKHSPVWLQNLACTFYGFQQKTIRYDDEFINLLGFLKKSEWWSLKEQEEYQDEQVRLLVNHAYENIPYYHSLFKKNEIKPSDVEGVEDLSKVPILTKELVRNNSSSLISKKLDKAKLYKFQTSGTSGKPLVFYKDKRAIQYQWAVWSRHKERFGVNYLDRHALFTGKPVIPLSQVSPPFWRINKGLNQTIFTMHHTQAEKMPSIVHYLNINKFEFFTGYPSIIYQYALKIEACRNQLTSFPKVIFTGAEPLLNYQKDVIERVFKAPVFDQYGTSEGVGNASKCTHGFYHFDFEFGVIEPDDTSGVNQSILMTGFANYAMPLIRYDIGDSGLFSKVKCKCGRKSPGLISVEGRNEDYVLTPEGNKIMRFDYVFKGVEGVEEAQVVQHQLGSISIYIVSSNKKPIKDENKIVDLIHSYISPKLKVEFEYVNHIARSTSGKFKAVVSKLTKNDSSTN